MNTYRPEKPEKRARIAVEMPGETARISKGRTESSKAVTKKIYSHKNMDEMENWCVPEIKSGWKISDEEMAKYDPEQMHIVTGGILGVFAVMQ